MQTLLQDLRFAVRSLRRSPGFTLVALVTLALGIGANTAVFSVLYGVLLKPLPYPEPERLVQLGVRSRGYEGELNVTYSQFRFLEENAKGLETMAAGASVGFNIVAGEGAVRAQGMRVSRDYFRTLGVAPMVGRDFTVEEDQPAGANAVILSHGFWQRVFGGDPGVLNRSITLDGAPYQVVGIMPAGFQVFPPVEAWSTLAQVGRTIGSGSNLRLFGRLAPGLSLAAAQERWRPMAGELQEVFRGSIDSSATIEPASSLRVATMELSRPVRVLAGAIAFVLLIACANVTSLVLGRGLARGRELALRQALGAGRGRLVRQLLTESTVLGLVGGGLGLLLATWGLQLLVSMLPGDIPRAGEIRLDGVALGYTLGLSLVVGLLVGLVPAWQASMGARPEALKVGTGRTTAGTGHTRLRDALVVGELALALVLLTGAGLLIRTFKNLLATDPGFDSRQVLSAEIWLTGTAYDSTVARADFYRRLMAELATLPGVTGAGVVEAGLPLARGGNLPVALDGERLRSAIDYRSVTPGYLETLGVPIRQGRGVSESDTEGGEPVVVVNETFANLFFGGTAAALGRQLAVGGGQVESRRVVGVVGDVRSFVGLPAPPTVFLPSSQTPAAYTRIFSSWFPIHVVLRAGDEPGRLSDALAATIRRVDPQVPVGRVRPLTDVLGQTLALQRFIMLVLGGFAGLALLLAVVGIYGLISYVVIQRTREIGVRMALGALPADVLRLVMGRGLLLTLAGVALGLLSAALLTQLLVSQLHGVEPLDPGTFAVGALSLAVVALAASAIPALRAGRVDPLVALRAD